MRSGLVNGRLPDPRSLGAARARHEQLTYEIGRIDRQIADPAASARHPAPGVRDAWIARAGRARRYMAEEARQLALWIDAHPETDLLREARDLLVRLRGEDIEFDADELAVIARLKVACEGAVDGAATRRAGR